MNNILSCVCLYDEVKIFESSIIDTIINQTYKSDILIVDNYEHENISQYNDVFIHKCRKCSVSEIREYCIEYASNRDYKYIAFFDADDIYEKNRIEVCINLLIQNNVDYIVHNMSIVDYKGNKIFPNFLNKNNNYFELLKEDILVKNFIGLGNTIYKISALKRVPKCPDKVIFDWWIAIHLVYLGKQGIITYANLSQYRQYSKNTASVLIIDEQKVYTEFIVKMYLYLSLLEDKSINLNKNKVETLIQNLVNQYVNKNYCLGKSLLGIGYWWCILDCKEEKIDGNNNIK